MFFIAIIVCFFVLAGAFAWFQARYPIDYGILFYFGSGDPELSYKVTMFLYSSEDIWEMWNYRYESLE